MKPKEVETEFGGERRRLFMRALLRDLHALERILAEGGLEEGVRRVGAEQEMFLIDQNWHPAPAALDILAKIDDKHFTTELGLFNLELNLDPAVFGDDCLSRMEAQIDTLVRKVRGVAADLGVGVVLTGILPTIRKSDLGIHNITPIPRYLALNEVMTQLRGGTYEFYIKGVDELLIKHDSVMVEAANASFQVHFQVGAGEFANLYNLAQVAAGPVLAASTNSPLLFGRRLWSETRIALFQQAVDTRSPGHHPRESIPRVTFGNSWIRKSVIELYREDIARFRTLVGIDLDEDPFAVLDRGEVPELKALRLHNGTIYRWNRACYGVLNGKPHLRIENRVLPSGPSIVDQVANAAFWYGLISTLSDQYDDITKVIEFEHAKMNFVTAARQGLGAHFTWLEGKEVPAAELILDSLLPLAEEGLLKRGIRDADVKRYLGVIERRVRSGRTGSRWLLMSLAGMKDQGTAGERLNALTAATIARQKENLPVSEWERARIEEGGGWKHNYFRVEQYMTTNIFSVQPDESVDLVANLMEWEKIRHVPVEDHEHRLVGLVSYRSVIRALADARLATAHATLAVSDIMRTELSTVTPETTTLDAIALMREKQIGCLPVVSNGKLVGIVTDHDFMDIARELLEQKLKE